ncbi:hypothetical protein G7046_g3005 [Stylonectria norvegica]|nr:hypothetical protein G7046_g3005 [Stylonectria norvegica]
MMWYVGDIPIVQRNHGMIVSGFLFTLFACLAGSLRIVTRAIIVRNVGLDDYFILAAMFGTLAFLTASLHQVKYGLGDTLLEADLHPFLQSLLATVIAYSFTQLTVKFSILLQCKRIFSSSNAQRLFIGLLTWMTIYGSFCFLSSVITCWPVAKYWDDSIAGGCIDRSKLHYVLAGFNIINDIAILIAPLPFLRKLHIARRAKIVLIAVFGCGGFACIVAIIRLHSLYVNNSAPVDKQPLYGVDIAVWSGLEINVAIVCASVPALKPLFVKAFPRLISSFTDSSKRSRPGRSTHGTLPLGSVDHRAMSRMNGEEENSGIQIHQTFEMKAVTASTHASVERDDSSEKNLVTGPGSTWTAECYADRRA